MSLAKVTKGCCLTCINACGVLIHVDHDKIVKVEGNPQHPFSRGFLCPKGLALKQIVYHPERLKYPLKRAGERGEGKWKRISWEEALEEIATKLAEAKHHWGSESVVFAGGFNAVASLSQNLGMFLHLFGSPNRLVNVHVCAMPAHMAGIYTTGFTIMSADFLNSRCILLWGLNPESAWRSQLQEIMEARDKGAKLIVVDPRLTSLASRADVWLQVRPGTDCALALGMLHIIINERLYEEEFVERWTVGFDQLCQQVQFYPPQRVEEITWVPATKLIEAARLYARSKPASLAPGAAGMCQSINAFQANRALAILAAVTGNLDVPGGNVHYLAPLRRRSAMAGEMDASFGKLAPEQLQRRLGSEDFRIISHAGLIFAHPAAVWQAILESKPYPVKAVLGLGGNPVVSFENSAEVRKALLSLEFFASASLFMNPTTELADIVLPAAH
jgi:anaerobic selenocysteine-containing dehydrogenase